MTTTRPVRLIAASILAGILASWSAVSSDPLLVAGLALSALVAVRLALLPEEGEP